MKLRPLLLTLAVLAPVSAAVWWFSRPAPAAAVDSRVGQRVADPSALASAARVKITSAGKSVELARGEGDRWTVVGEPALPADASRLTRFTGDLVSPKIDRLVSARPEKIAAYDLDSAGLVYSDASGKPLFELDLGKTLETGARVFRYGDETKAYAARLNVSLDADSASWRDTALVAGVQASDVASLSITLPDTSGPVVISRAKAEDPWTSPSTPAGHQVIASTLTAQLGNLTSLRYTNVAPNIDPGVIAARVFSRELALTTFSGRTVKISFARAPEPPAAPKPETKEGETAPATPPAAPRPVYVEITDSKGDSILAAAAKTHAFEIADWVFSALPSKTEELFEPVPAPATAAPAATSGEKNASAPATIAPPPASTPAVSVTTPPLTISPSETEPAPAPDAAPAAQPGASR